MFYECVDGKCVAEYTNVECTDDSECDAGWHCDTKLWKCVEGEEPIPDQNGEAIECEWWEDEIPAGTVEDCGFLGWKKTVPFVSCEIKTYEASCKISAWIYIAGAIIVLILLIVLVLAVSPKKKKRK